MASRAKQLRRCYSVLHQWRVKTGTEGVGATWLKQKCLAGITLATSLPPRVLFPSLRAIDCPLSYPLPAKRATLARLGASNCGALKRRILSDFKANPRGLRS